jgi:hypothetical protein
MIKKEMSADSVIGTFTREGFPKSKYNDKHYRDQYFSRDGFNNSFDYAKDHRNFLNNSSGEDRPRIISKSTCSVTNFFIMILS